ncbi:MAG: TonB-dependent receptor [Hyphomicrobium sp.]|nr:MAG: TonB-dependent receptor [Hyphomicrobium sp.]
MALFIRSLSTLVAISVALAPVGAFAQDATQPSTDTQAPAAATPQGATPPPSGDSAQKQLPEVEIIQTQPNTETVETETPGKPKPAKKKQTAARRTATKRKPKPQPAPEPEVVEATAPTEVTSPAPLVSNAGPLSSETTVQVAPLSGSEIPLAKVPISVGRASADQIATEGSGQVQQTLQQTVPGIIITDIGGSGFRTDVSYRGFDASPVGGRAQGLAVYQNGVRINESFGDAVNLDIIPSNAIQDITVMSSNPVFGLNAIGGAISIVMKDGFNYEGGEIDLMAGSFGRRQVGVQAGGNSGGVSAYFAGQYIDEDGFRDFSEAEVKRFYGDLGFKGDNSEIHFSLTAANSVAGVVAAAPVEVLDQGWGRTFTSPQDTEVEVFMPTLSAKVRATETLTFSGVGYYRHLKQRVIDGNLSEAERCDDNEDELCLGDEELEYVGGVAPTFDDDDAIGSIERINTDADSYGVALQAVEKSNLFGRPNQFLVGVSYDHGNVNYQTSSEVGTIGNRFVVSGTGAIVENPLELAPRNLDTENNYYGIYFTNTLDVTDQLAVTVGGRYNYATIDLKDLTGNFENLTADTTYERFNPTVGATYAIMPGLSIYGSYSEANRAPTAAETGCADEEFPCFIESFLTDDPPLKQVVSKSVEAGIRGESKSWDGERFSWSLGYFRTLNTDDILNVASQEVTGRGYFLNAGDTLREGFEAAVGYQTSRVSMYASYAFVDATFRDNVILPAPNTPTGTELCPEGDDDGDDDDDGPALCNYVQSGDSLPGIPKHRFKAGIAYWLTPKWKIGTDLVAASDQFFFGDEANNNRKLSGYTRVDLNTSYDITDNIQVYGLVKNIFDRRYGLYGTFFDTEETNESGATEAAGYDEDFEDARSITPSLPFAAYGGVKIKF